MKWKLDNKNERPPVCGIPCDLLDVESRSCSQSIEWGAVQTRGIFFAILGQSVNQLALWLRRETISTSPRRLSSWTTVKSVISQSLMTPLYRRHVTGCSRQTSSKPCTLKVGPLKSRQMTLKWFKVAFNWEVGILSSEGMKMVRKVLDLGTYLVAMVFITHAERSYLGCEE